MATKIVCDRCLVTIEGQDAYASKRLTFTAMYLKGIGSEIAGEPPIDLCADCISIVKRDIRGWSEMRSSMVAK